MATRGKWDGRKNGSAAFAAYFWLRSPATWIETGLLLGLIACAFVIHELSRFQSSAPALALRNQTGQEQAARYEHNHGRACPSMK